MTRLLMLAIAFGLQAGGLAAEFLALHMAVHGGLLMWFALPIAALGIAGVFIGFRLGLEAL